MSHITCPKCGGTEHMTGYGYAAGILGGYTFCESEDCGALLELWPDLEGLTEERAKELLAEVAKWRESVWGTANPTTAGRTDSSANEGPARTSEST